MAGYAKVLQNTLEVLYDDECLRSNLTDAEATVVLDWASAWITEQVSAAKNESTAKQIAQSELARVKLIISAINDLAKKPGIPSLSNAVAALGLKVPTTLTRPQMWRVLVTLTATVWQAAQSAPASQKETR